MSSHQSILMAQNRLPGDVERAKDAFRSLEVAGGHRVDISSKPLPEPSRPGLTIGYEPPGDPNWHCPIPYLRRCNRDLPLSNQRQEVHRSQIL